MRIRKTPAEEELDGVRLKDMHPGSIREVSSIIGAWLIAERYAEPEMRKQPTYEDDFLVPRDPTSRTSGNTPRRRAYER